jgi:hypothetical protein
MQLQDSLYLEESDLSGDLEEVSEMHMKDSLYLEERDLSGDLEEISEDTFA